MSCRPTSGAPGALVYKRNLHVIDVFLWPAAGLAEVAPHLTIRNGYNLLS